MFLDYVNTKQCALCKCTVCTVQVYSVYCASVQCALCKCTVCTVQVYSVHCASVQCVLCKCTVCTVQMYSVYYLSVQRLHRSRLFSLVVLQLKLCIYFVLIKVHLRTCPDFLIARQNQWPENRINKMWILHFFRILNAKW